MKDTFKYFLLTAIATSSFAAYANNSSLELTEQMSLNLDMNDYVRQATYLIRYPGSDTWIDNGKIHVTKKMPACLIVLSDELNQDQLIKFINEIKVTTNGKELPLESYKGTLTFVDRNPFNSSFTETDYVIKTKNNLTFGQLLQYAGGNKDSRVSIFFNRGCVDLATRAYLPSK